MKDLKVNGITKAPRLPSHNIKAGKPRGLDIDTQLEFLLEVRDNAEDAIATAKRALRHAEIDMARHLIEQGYTEYLKVNYNAIRRDVSKDRELLQQMRDSEF